MTEVTKKVWVARGVWSFKKTPIFAIETSEAEIQQQATQVVRDYQHRLCSFITDWQFHNAQEAFKQAKIAGCATVPQDGNCEGWGISFISAEQAITLAKKTSEAHAKQQEEEENKQKAKDQKYIKHLQELPAKVRNKTVYFYIKQDYQYRGLDETFSGKITIQDLCDLEVARLMSYRKLEKATEQRVLGRFNSDVIQFSFNDLFAEGTAVTKLLKSKRKSVSVSGETGYIALSFKSVKDARELVAKLIIKHQLDE